MEDLRQRLFEAEDRALGAEQEVEQWRAEVEQLKETTRQEGENTKEALTEQLAAKTILVEQLIEKGSGRQLELDNLCAQNKLLPQLQSHVSQRDRHMERKLASVRLRCTVPVTSCWFDAWYLLFTVQVDGRHGHDWVVQLHNGKKR